MSVQLRKYETIIVARPEMAIDEYKALHKKVTDVFGKHSGDLIVFEVWGKRRLAYPIKKNQKGYYTYYMYAADNSVVQELNAMLRLRDDVLKYLTVKLADTVDSSALDKERKIEEFQSEDKHVETDTVSEPAVAEPPAEVSDGNEGKTEE